MKIKNLCEEYVKLIVLTVYKRFMEAHKFCLCHNLLNSQWRSFIENVGLVRNSVRSDSSLLYLKTTEQPNCWQLNTEHAQNQQLGSRLDITPRRMEHNEKYNKVICLGWNWCYLLTLAWTLFVIVRLRPWQFSITSSWFNMDHSTVHLCP